MTRFLPIILLSLFVAIDTNAQTKLPLKPDSTYVHLYDVELSDEKIYGDQGILEDGITFYTTSSFDSHEGRGPLYLGTKGVFFKRKLLCGWQGRHLVNCPADLPLIIEPDKNGKLSIYLNAENMRDEEPVFTFQGQELFLKRNSLEEEQTERWEVVKTDANGEITQVR